MATKNKRITQGMIGLTLAAFFAVTASVSAQAAGGPYSQESSNGAISVVGDVVFNSSGTATVTGMGNDNASDGLGPYLNIYYYGSGYAKSIVRSCSAGAGHSCPIPTFTTPSALPTVTTVKVQACTGSGGYTSNCGDIKTFTR